MSVLGLWTTPLGSVALQPSEAAIASHPRPAKNPQLLAPSWPITPDARPFTPSVGPTGGACRSFLSLGGLLSPTVEPAPSKVGFPSPPAARIHQLSAPSWPIPPVPRPFTPSVGPTEGTCTSVLPLGGPLSLEVKPAPPKVGFSLPPAARIHQILAPSWPIPHISGHFSPSVEPTEGVCTRD